MSDVIGANRALKDDPVVTSALTRNGPMSKHQMFSKVDLDILTTALHLVTDQVISKSTTTSIADTLPTCHLPASSVMPFTVAGLTPHALIPALVHRAHAENLQGKSGNADAVYKQFMGPDLPKTLLAIAEACDILTIASAMFPKQPDNEQKPMYLSGVPIISEKTSDDPMDTTTTTTTPPSANNWEDVAGETQV